MKLIKPSFEIIEQQPGLVGIYKQIELAGRTCYKSLDKITEDSAKEFVDRMVKSGHGAMLEHGTVYLTIPGEYEPDEWGRAEVFTNYKGKYTYNKYSKVNWERWEQEPVGTQCDFCCSISRSKRHITTNYRVLAENGWLDDLKYQCEPTEYHKKRVTVKFITDQGILREFTRHRTMSFAVESTRYCNYSKNKFNNEITFIAPNWLEDSKEINSEAYDNAYEIFCSAMEQAEGYYMMLIENGFKPQQARNVLPLATKCDLVMTGFVSDWKHFFELRCPSSAHPQARELAIPLKEEFIKRNLIC